MVDSDGFLFLCTLNAGGVELLLAKTAWPHQMHVGQSCGKNVVEDSNMARQPWL